MTETQSQHQTALDHIDRVCTEAGLEVMAQVLSIVWNREEVPAAELCALDAEDVEALYEAFIGPAVDRVERHLLAQSDPRSHACGD